MSQRYFVDTPIHDLQARLQGAEAHHLAQVMRAECGNEVSLFDGSGFEFRACIRKIGRSEVELEIVDRRQVDRELARHIALAVSLPKGDRQRWLVEKATELGVARLVPLTTQHSIAQPVGNAISRLRRAVIEASKQCRRNRLMEIAEPVQIREYVNAAPVEALRYIAHPGSRGVESAEVQHAHFAAAAHGTSRQPIIFAVGPEGGFSEDEVSTAVEAGWQPLDLGPRILRVETAAVALAACVALSSGGLSH
jgi:16S rRNA (uracil1498-N3)-methyltransferase